MIDSILERPLPSAPEIEETVLGEIFLDNELMDQAVRWLEPSDFYVQANRKVFDAMLSLHQVGMDLDPVSVAAELARCNELNAIGGKARLDSLYHGLPRVSSLASYAKTLRGKSLMRQLIKAANKITSDALEEEDDPDVVLDHAEQAVFLLRDARKLEGRGVVSMKQMAQKARTHLGTLNSQSETTIPTPWLHLNHACRGGLNMTELWGLIGIQKHGKSGMAKQICDYAAQHGHRSLIFSREMSALKIFYRFLAPRTEIPASQIRAGLDLNRVNRSIAATKGMEDLGVFVDDYTSDIVSVRTKTREMVRLEKVDLIVADYTNQFSAHLRKGANRSEEVATIWRGLKNIAQEFNVAVLALSHPTADSYEKNGHNDRRNPDGRVAPLFHMSAESREAAKAVDVGLVLWTELGKGDPGARPATLYIDYQREEDAGGNVPLIFNGRIMEFHEPQEASYGARY